MSLATPESILLQISMKQSEVRSNPEYFDLSEGYVGQENAIASVELGNKWLC